MGYSTESRSLMLGGGCTMPNTKIKLLIVDDESSIRTALSEIFTEFGHSVRSAEDGFTALIRIREEIPDILLSDLSMPGISGLELLSVIRCRFPAIRTIAMSGSFSGDRVPAGVYAEGFYEKGTHLGSLLQIVEGMTHREAPSFAQRPSMSASVLNPNYGHAHITLTCPECLRAFAKDLDEAISPVHETGCVYCYSFDSLRNRLGNRSRVFAGFSAAAGRVDGHANEPCRSQLVKE